MTFDLLLLTDNSLASNHFERPMRLQEIPQWSFNLVLSFLKGALFEALEEASLEDLTRKTVFLIFLASGRHHSKVHSFLGFPFAVSFPDAQDQVTLVELPGFLAKNQAPTGSSPLVKIPALQLTRGPLIWTVFYALCGL